MIPTANSIFDCQVERRTLSPEINEEEKVQPEMHEFQAKLDHLMISANGLRVKTPAKWDNNPQQISKTFNDCGITISSSFDSGNLYKAVKV
jgi:hypothetical protein